jgi:hypothetical protein
MCCPFSPSESLVTMNSCGNTGSSLNQATRYLRRDLLPLELQISNAAVYWITKRPKIDSNHLRRLMASFFG